MTPDDAARLRVLFTPPEDQDICPVQKERFGSAAHRGEIRSVAVMTVQTEVTTGAGLLLGLLQPDSGTVTTLGTAPEQAVRAGRTVSAAYGFRVSEESAG
ncbi:hypothetical protein GCM10009727_15790 [Actinomadura napierensis]|uniref:Uncharacterized protein n=2 Tax=Actinomadura napierensis TaxID=267854 RepID=A0ABP5K355_9ACTN